MPWRFFSGVTFVLLCFALFCFVFVSMLSLKPQPFVQSSFECRRPGSHTCFYFWRCRFFRVFLVPFPLSLCMESTSYVLSFRMVFSTLWPRAGFFDISLCENSINQSNISVFHFILWLSSRVWSDGLYFLVGVFSCLNLLLVFWTCYYYYFILFFG